MRNLSAAAACVASVVVAAGALMAQVPMKRGCTYEDVANMLVFLAYDESAYMTGQAINVTGGQEMN